MAPIRLAASILLQSLPHRADRRQQRRRRLLRARPVTDVGRYHLQPVQCRDDRLFIIRIAGLVMTGNRLAHRTQPVIKERHQFFRRSCGNQDDEAGFLGIARRAQRFSLRMGNLTRDRPDLVDRTAIIRQRQSQTRNRLIDAPDRLLQTKLLGVSACDGAICVQCPGVDPRRDIPAGACGINAIGESAQGEPSAR